MILIDSSAWIEYLAAGPKSPRIAGHMGSPGRIVTPTVVLYEVYKKLKKERGEEAALVATGQLTQTRIVPLESHLALSAADLSLTYAIPMADAIVAATGQAESAKILTLDKDFAKIPWADVL